VATDDDNATAQSIPIVRLVNFPAHPPVVSKPDATVDRNSVTITCTVTDEDNDLESVLVSVGNTTVTATIGSNTYTARLNDMEPGDHTAKVTAIDSLEQTGTRTVEFSITFIPPPSATGTIQKHCEAGRIPWDQFSRYYLKYNLNEFTVYQMPDGTWSDLSPGGACFSAPVSEHESQGRAYSETGGWWFWEQTTYYANGSNDLLGSSSESIVSLRQSDATHWHKVETCH
jgi:hypothetical protein